MELRAESSPRVWFSINRAEFTPRAASRSSRLWFHKKPLRARRFGVKRERDLGAVDKNYLFAWGAAIRGAGRVCARDLSTPRPKPARLSGHSLVLSR
ncbi:unnamed protein product, partial [Iphiclides podalirius]